MRKTVFPFLLLVFASAVHAREYSPRVLSPRVADAYSMKTFRQFPRWRELKGDQLAWEVYKYLVDTHTGVFHMNPVYEGNDVLSEYTIVRDPVKTVNVYGYAFCGALGPTMAGVCEDMGIGKARTLSLPGWNHVASEVFYDGKWDYLDLDVHAVFRRKDGTLASMDDARRDPSLWQGRGPLFFPNDSLQKTRQVYLKTPVHHYHGFNQSGHTMDYVLRQGETFTRWWKPQGGRWHHNKEYNKNAWLRKLIEQQPRGPKPNHRDFTVHNYANGRFVYEPNLTSKSTDFADGAYDAENVRPAADGLALIRPGTGHAIFEILTPYVVVPVVGDLETTADDREASVVELHARGATLSISTDGGLTWRQLPVSTDAKMFDLTPHVAGTYGYLLKVMLHGKPGEAVVRRLKITTWVQVAPASLPSLQKGENRMQYRTGDDYGLKTRVVQLKSDCSDPSGFVKHLVEPPNDYDPSRKTARVRGPMTVRVAAPPGMKIAWLAAGGSFNTHQRAAAKNTRNAIAYAVDQPENFQVVYRAEVPTDTEHWHNNATPIIKLKQPARIVFIRYTGDPGINNFNIYAHCLDDGRPSVCPVTITHAWSENGIKKTKAVTPKHPGPYTIITGAEPVNKSVEIAVPSDVR